MLLNSLSFLFAHLLEMQSYCAAWARLNSSYNLVCPGTCPILLSAEFSWLHQTQLLVILIYGMPEFPWSTLLLCSPVSRCFQLYHCVVQCQWTGNIFYPDVLIAHRHHHWLLTLTTEERNDFSEWRSILNCFYLLSFLSHFILFCSILWQENETKGRGSLHTFYFKLQFIWASNMSVLFNSLGWYLSGFLKYNTH